METMNNILNELEDEILRSRISLSNSKLLTLKEIFLIETIINEQGITTNFPEKALSYAKPKIACKYVQIMQLYKMQDERKLSNDQHYTTDRQWHYYNRYHLGRYKVK